MGEETFSHRNITCVNVDLKESPREAGRAYGKAYSAEIADQARRYHEYFELLGVDPWTPGETRARDTCPDSAGLP